MLFSDVAAAANLVFVDCIFVRNAFSVFTGTVWSKFTADRVVAISDLSDRDVRYPSNSFAYLATSVTNALTIGESKPNAPKQILS